MLDLSRHPSPAVLRSGALLSCLALACGAPQGDDWYYTQAEEARELARRAAVTVNHLSREELLRQRMAAAAQQDPAQLRATAESYGRLGFFPPDIDLGVTIATTSSDWVGGFYSSATRSLTVIGAPADSLLVHEYTHALQDQHFDLASFRQRAPATSDASLAASAIIEGDAELTTGRFIYRQDGADLDQARWGAAFGNHRDRSASYLKDQQSPLFFRAQVSFVYAYGLENAARVLTGATFALPSATERAPYDFGRLDALLRGAPTTTRQILYPGAPAPAPVGLGAVPVALAASLSQVGWDSMGTWYTYLLLLPVRQDALALAAGWRADRALFVRDKGSGQVGALWALRWSAPAVADAVAQALLGVHKVAGWNGGEGRTDRGEPFCMRVDGTVVAFLRNVAPALCSALLDAALPPAAAAGEASDQPETPALLPSLGGRLRTEEACLARALEGAR